MMALSAFLVAMATDTPTLAIVLGFIGTVVTAITGGFVAVNLNKNEKKQSAETVLEKALRERIALRDEQMAELREDLERVTEERDRAIAQRDHLYMVIAKQGKENPDVDS